MTDYLVYDVFTEAAFTGNPLAVIPDATGLAEADLQRIAREFNFSETTFVYPPENPEHDAKVRIFNPTAEMAFAGHPTVGTALAMHSLGRVGDDMVLELGVGPIPVTVRDGHARFVTRVPLATGPAPETGALAACLGLEAGAIRTDRHAPVTAGLGTDFVLAELASFEALDAALPDLDAFRRAAADARRMSIFVYTRNGAQIDARMFAPLSGTFEDPATGSAIAALAAFLGWLDGRSQAFHITQGVQMGRPSRIEAEVTVENGEPVAVAIGGHAVKVMEGRLAI